MLIYCEKIRTVKKNKEGLLFGSKEVGHEVNAEEMKYNFMSCQQNVGQHHNI
jgi:hypothetical protein